MEYQVILSDASHTAESAVQIAVSKVLEGEAPAVPLLGFIHHLEALLADAKKQVKEHAINEVRGTSGVRTGMYICNVKAGSGRWSFDHIEQWVEAKEHLKQVEETAKAAYKLNSSGALWDSDGGVVTSDGEVVKAGNYIKYDDTLEFRRAK